MRPLPPRESSSSLEVGGRTSLVRRSQSEGDHSGAHLSGGAVEHDCTWIRTTRRPVKRSGRARPVPCFEMVVPDVGRPIELRILTRTASNPSAARWSHRHPRISASCDFLSCDAWQGTKGRTRGLDRPHAGARLDAACLSARDGCARARVSFGDVGLPQGRGESEELSGPIEGRSRGDFFYARIWRFRLGSGPIGCR